MGYHRKNMKTCVLFLFSLNKVVIIIQQRIMEYDGQRKLSSQMHYKGKGYFYIFLGNICFSLQLVSNYSFWYFQIMNKNGVLKIKEQL